MLNQEKPDDYVTATGEMHFVRELVDIAFASVDLEADTFIVIDDNFFRPSEENVLRGDYSKAKKDPGWEPKVRFEELIKMMVDEDLSVLHENHAIR